MPEERLFSDFSFKQFLSEGKIMGCQCRSCGASFLPPKPICTRCHSRDLAWQEIPATGKLAAFTCITIAPKAMQQEGYGRDKPYCSGVVEFEGGLRADARIVGIDPGKPESIRVGMAMQADFIKKEIDGVQTTLLAFRPL